MSTHAVRIIRIAAVLPHGNADSLEIVPIDGWQAVVKKGSFAPGDKAIYIQPDYVVPTKLPEFAFLARDGKESYRLRAIRLRGELSFGLLIPVPDELSDKEVGDDVMADLGIIRYEPPQKFTTGGDALSADNAPKAFSPKFDIESLANYPHVLEDGEPILVTEKIHGANARYVFEDGEFFMGSRNRWLKAEGGHAWLLAAQNDPRIQTWCEAHPGVILYGEVYGAVQSLKYGAKAGEIKFAAFAALDHGTWINTAQLHNDDTIPTAPLLAHTVWRPALAQDILAMAEDDSTVPGAPKGHMREGIVICPVNERQQRNVGRVIFKHISARYWTSGNG